MLEVWQRLAEAILIGVLTGAQREMAAADRREGLRDFVAIAVIGGICGVLENAALTAAALLSVVALSILYHTKASTAESGVTTELAAVATFCLAFLTATPGRAPLAIGLTIFLVAMLEAKRQIHKFVREGITSPEFNSTLIYLAMVLVIYPVLPEASYGPYHFFTPRRIWLFVILVSSISYIGYFIQKFLGVERGLTLVAVLGGIASTTAATAALARGYRDQPEHLNDYWRAAVLANTILFPRVWVILFVVEPRLAMAAIPSFAAMTIAGALLYGALFWIPRKGVTGTQVPLGNPFRLLPALQFGAIFAFVLLLTKWATEAYGGSASLAAAGVAGSMDVDAVVVSLAELLREGHIDVTLATRGVLLAITANAIVKTALAGSGGRLGFAIRLGLSFVVLLGAGWVIAVLP